MNNFRNAMTHKMTRTENGMVTHADSGSALVDLFFTMGAGRNLPENVLVQKFANSFAETPLYTLKAMFYNRDIRGGQGERRSFRLFLKWLCVNQPELAGKVLHLVPEYGRWDDVFVAFDTPVERVMFALVAQGLKSGDKLLAKWMPSENKSKNALAIRFMIEYRLKPKEYRKLLSGNRQVVETLMCSYGWSEINFSSVPSVASNKYRKAFYKHEPTRYASWVEQVKAGVKKVNAGAIFPHEILHKLLEEMYKASYTYRYSEDKTIIDSCQVQWDALPNYIPEGKTFLPVCDVSGSMAGLPMEVSIALGIYLAERNKTKFGNMFFTFSGNPQLVTLNSKSLFDNVKALQTCSWGMNTNLEKMFTVMLTNAVQWNLPPEDMPSVLLILSDMQFDQATKYNYTAMDMIKEKYKSAGYPMPQVVFWNLRASSGIPATVNEQGVSLVSGFSPSIMKSLLSGEGMTPLRVVLQTLDQERYSKVTM